MERYRRLLVEELECRKLLAGSSIVMAGAPTVRDAVEQNALTSPASTDSQLSNPAQSPFIIGAAVELTPLILSQSTLAPVTQAPLVLSSGAINPVGSTQLQLIIALGEDALTATDVPNASPGAAVSTLPNPWTPSLGVVTPLSQVIGGTPTRTESLEHGVLGLFNRMGRESHGRAPTNAFENQRDQTTPERTEDRDAEEDSYNILGVLRQRDDEAVAAIDKAIVEIGASADEARVQEVDAGEELIVNSPPPLRPISW